MPKKITIPNTLPHLIDALWNHPDCPKRLQDDLWGVINNRIEGNTEMTPTYWKSQLESCRSDEPGEHEERLGGIDPEWPGLIDQKAGKNGLEQW